MFEDENLRKCMERYIPSFIRKRDFNIPQILEYINSGIRLFDAKDTVNCITEEIESHKRAYERRGKDKRKKEAVDLYKTRTR